MCNLPFDGPLLRQQQKEMAESQEGHDLVKAWPLQSYVQKGLHCDSFPAIASLFKSLTINVKNLDFFVFLLRFSGEGMDVL